MRKIITTVGGLFVLMLTMSFAVTGEWFLFEDKGWQIKFPVKPNPQTKTITSAVGDLKMDILMYDASKVDAGDSNFVYMVITTDYPDSVFNSDRPANLPTFFKNCIDGAVKNVNGKLLSEKEIAMDGFPGREITVDFRNGLAIIKARCYLVRSKLCMIQTITKSANYPNAAMDRFMGSFILRK